MNRCGGIAVVASRREMFTLRWEMFALRWVMMRAQRRFLFRSRHLANRMPDHDRVGVLPPASSPCLLLRP